MTSASPADRAPQGGRPRGRPRDAERDEAITTACIGLVSEMGFDRLRVQDVADRAGVGLATIYRRWPTKRDLLVHAVTAHEGPAVALSGDARRDLVALLTALAGELSSKTAEFIPSVLAILREDPELGEMIRERSLCDMRRQFQAILREAGSLSEADVDVRADVGPAMLLYRVLFMGDAADAKLVNEIADVMLGVTAPAGGVGAARQAARRTPGPRKR